MLTIDRFEGDFAVVETSDGFVNIPKEDLPKGAKEGSVLALKIDAQGEKARREYMTNLVNDLFVD